MLDVCFNSNTDFLACRNWFEQIKDVTSLCIYSNKTHKEATITIAIPTYKRAELLSETIDSALNQVGYDDYNIIVVDNNPERNDVTEQLMQRYKNQRVAYYKNAQNIFMGGNWNRCFELINAPWGVLLHDDDTISPCFVRKIVDAIKQFPKAAVIQTENVNDKKDLLQKNQLTDVTYTRYGRFDFYKGPSVSGVPTGCAYRKDCVMSLGGFPYDQYQGYSYWFHINIVQKYTYYKINLPLTYYRISQQNASNSGDLHETWICYEYWLIRNLMIRHHVPSFIYKPFLIDHALLQYHGLRTLWKTKFNFPLEHRLYPCWRTKLSNMYLKIYASILRHKACNNDNYIGNLFRKHL